jgi:carboxylesterase type B
VFYLPTYENIFLSNFHQADAVKIQEQINLYPQMDAFPTVFKPYIDDFSSNPFMPKDPWELIESGSFNDVPLIIGNNNDEGLMTTLKFYLNSDLIADLRNRWNEELGPLLIAGR